LSSHPKSATIGVFGTEGEAKTAFEAAVSKKSEAEGIVVYHRTEGGRKISLLDTNDFPERIQGYSRIASICDHAYYMIPRSGKLSPADGELAVLLEAFGLPGTIQLLDGTPPDSARPSLRGTAVSDFPLEERNSASSVLDASQILPREDFPTRGTLVYLDRAFTVKGVGTVALGFVLSGEVSVHDQLRPVPGPGELRADVKGIQINDVDFERAGRGVRVGLSLRGVDPQDLENCHWLDDGSLTVKDRLSLDFRGSPFYRPDVRGRDLHLQLPGETLPARIERGEGSRLTAILPTEVPAWEGMKTAILDLNGRPLRVAGGGTCMF
jgi:selenocysteine-specific translation elongation factor